MCLVISYDVILGGVMETIRIGMESGLHVFSRTHKYLVMSYQE